ncbi:MAG: hypothetical protein O7D95_06505 [Betaproteobacteria bacterium]|nr:hypothetical protein [Betaproteobacteria bacterium]
MATVSTSFTSVAAGEPILIKRDDDYTYSLSGTFSATCRLEYSDSAGVSWITLVTATSPVSSTTRTNNTNKDFLIRWNCTVFGSGTAVSSIADADILIEEIVNNRGVPVVQTRESGQVVTGTQSVSGSKMTTQNLGADGVGVTAVETGDGNQHTTTITLAGVLPAITGGVNQAVGLLIYTFPAGAIVINHAYISVGITQSEGNIDNDQPEVGLGTVIGTGAVAVLSTTLEDIITGQVAANCTGTATVKTAIPTAAVPFVIETAAAHTLHFNAADGWAASGDLAATVAGTIVIDWSFVN